MESLGLVLPALLAQDGLRYIFFARNTPGRAALNDFVWLLVQGALFAALGLLSKHTSFDTWLLAWGVAAAVALGVGLLQARLLPNFRAVWHWVTRDQSRVMSFLGDFVAMTGTNYLALQSVSLISGLQAFGALRGAEFLFAPLAVIVSGARLFILPFFGEAASGGRTSLRSRVATAALGLYSVALLWSLFVLAVLPGFGSAVLGHTWTIAKPLLLAVAIFSVVRSGALAALDGIRALGGGRRLVLVRTIGGLLILVSAITGALLNGAAGAATAMAIAMTLAAMVAWDGFRRATFGNPPAPLTEPVRIHELSFVRPEGTSASDRPGRTAAAYVRLRNAVVSWPTASSDAENDRHAR
jgi:hypothetical protein